MRISFCHLPCATFLWALLVFVSSLLTMSGALENDIISIGQDRQLFIDD